MARAELNNALAVLNAQPGHRVVDGGAIDALHHAHGHASQPSFARRAHVMRQRVKRVPCHACERQASCRQRHEQKRTLHVAPVLPPSLGFSRYLPAMVVAATNSL